MNSPVDKLVGQQLGAYTINEAVGRGGMARVYKGFHKDLNRYAAIKVIEMGLSTDEEFIQRFRREAQAIASLKHANIVTIYDFAAFEYGYYLVMEYIDGHDLESTIVAGEEISPDTLQSIVFDIASALDHAHGHDVIHRDVKPSNIMITHSGQAILTDFGLVMLPNSAANTTQGNAFGTPYYMAPEQATSSSAASSASDIYSLGCIIFELLAGKPPYEADSPLGVALKHVSDPIPNIQERASTVPDSVRGVIEKAMAKDASDRFTSAGEMAVALTEAWSHPEPMIVTTPVIVPPLAPTPPILAPSAAFATNPIVQTATLQPKRERPLRLIWGALLVLLLVVLTVGVGLSLQQPGELNQANAASASSTPLLAEGEDKPDSLITPTALAATATPTDKPPTQIPTLLPTETPTPVPTETATLEPIETATLAVAIVNTPPAAEPLTVLQDKILFKTDRSGRVEIYQMNADGSNAVALDTDLLHLYNEAIRWEAFSPDRQETVVVRGDTLFDLWHVNLGAGTERPISPDPANDYDPAWSPITGDNRIIFVSERTGRGDLYLFDLANDGVYRLTHDELEFEKHPSWSSDGRQIVYWSDSGGLENAQIFILDLETVQRINVSNDSYRNWDPVWVK